MISQAFLQPEVRRRLSGRICVCDAFFASERCSAGLLVHLYRCGLVFGPTGGARERFCSDGTRLEGGRLERRRFHRQARGDEARRALQG